jgi:hypothetical protein
MPIRILCARLREVQPRSRPSDDEGVTGYRDNVTGATRSLLLSAAMHDAEASSDGFQRYPSCLATAATSKSAAALRSADTFQHSSWPHGGTRK